MQIMSNLVLAISGILFMIGLIGAIAEMDIIKLLISFEIMLFAAILNFCCFAGSSAIRIGHFAGIIALVLGGVVFALIFTLSTKYDEDVLEESESR